MMTYYYETLDGEGLILLREQPRKRTGHLKKLSITARKSIFSSIPVEI
jgi:hypothetical protein